jgi:poly-gamma-glutamate capsule biosynthesis protein CapA/YwtB (metallophosphatase superfamily)
VSLRRPSRRPPILAALGLLVVGVFVALAASLNPALPGASHGLPTLPVGLRSASPGGEPSDVASNPSPTADSSIALVPVTSFRSPWVSTDAAEVATVAAGTSQRYRVVEVIAAGSEATLLGVGVNAPQTGLAVTLADDAATLKADLAAHPDRLGFLPLADVDPSVRALAWGGVSLFGVHRLATLEGWPLRLRLTSGTVPATTNSYDPATAWTVVAGGDINLDGQVAYHVKQLGLGVDFPFAGGTATITSHYCCSSAGLPLPRAQRTGSEGAVHDLLTLADLAIADFENPAPDNFQYHPAGLTFSADPDLIEGLANAGIDWVSLANNHIGDYGDQGVLDTLKNLDRWGIDHGGAEADLDAARAPSLFEEGGISVAILGYDTVKPAYAATASSPGSNEMSVARVTADVQAARAAGAGLVIVFAHWGVEYSATTTALQRGLAHAAIDAGADIVIGSHTHMAGGLEVYKGRPIFYSLGDFVFNVTRSEQTEEGIVVELTFAGSRLVQAQILPHLILDGSQPNLLDPAGSGKVVLKQVLGASPGLPW